MEKDRKMGIEELLAGTPLLTFLQEMVAIKDEEIVDNLPPIKEGEVVLGDMTPFEKRINLWVDRRTEKEASIRAEALSKNCEATILSAHEFIAGTRRRFVLLWESVAVRYPQVKTTPGALRQGFKIVTNVHVPHQEVNVAVIGDLSSFLGALGAVSAHMRQ